jgi:hypothetical protein
MVQYEFLSNGAEETGIWDAVDLPMSNMDLLQKVRWEFLPNGKVVLEMDEDVAKLLSRKRPDPENTPVFDHSKRFSTLEPE